MGQQFLPTQSWRPKFHLLCVERIAKIDFVAELKAILRLAALVYTHILEQLCIILEVPANNVPGCQRELMSAVWTKNLDPDSLCLVTDQLPTPYAQLPRPNYQDPIANTHCPHPISYTQLPRSNCQHPIANTKMTIANCQVPAAKCHA